MNGVNETTPSVPERINATDYFFDEWFELRKQKYPNSKLDEINYKPIASRYYWNEIKGALANGQQVNEDILKKNNEVYLKRNSHLIIPFQIVKGKTGKAQTGKPYFILTPTNDIQNPNMPKEFTETVKLKEDWAKILGNEDQMVVTMDSAIHTRIDNTGNEGSKQIDVFIAKDEIIEGDIVTRLLDGKDTQGIEVKRDVFTIFVEMFRLEAVKEPTVTSGVATKVHAFFASYWQWIVGGVVVIGLGFFIKYIMNLK
jgi:hypothetical protein